jgi:glutamate formiminotransferase
MTARVLEAVPNFSEGRDLGVLRAIVDAVEHAGARVLDASADPDHNRSVVTFIGEPVTVEDAALAAARVAVETIDLRTHEGVHPRIGALDVLPFVPLSGLTLSDACVVAHRAGDRLAAELGLPVFYYGEASQPRGRGLAELRRGGFEQLVDAWPADRQPDRLPTDWSRPGAHPSAGAVCVGARDLLLAWNVVVDHIPVDTASAIAAQLRESGGGVPGLRALALELPRRNAVQISMNLEDVERAAPMEVFRLLERAIAEAGGRVRETEVIGLIPDRLLADAAADRLRMDRSAEPRMLSRRLAEYLAERADDGSAAATPGSRMQ